MSDLATFINVSTWLQEIDHHASESVMKVLIGNKSDKFHREVDRRDAQNFADKIGVKLMESSARDDHNIDEIFFHVAKELKKKLGSPVYEIHANEKTAFLGGSTNIIDDKFSCCSRL